MSKPSLYYIPYKFRRVENLHILLWLIKDACWALNLKYPALFMIIPTLLVAIMITYQTRKITSEFLHNLAIDFWITANCTWMVGEFYGWDANLIGPYGLREFSLLPFGIGLLILGYYYLIYIHKKDFEDRVHRQTEQVISEQVKKD
ncbi:MAG: hypothetical protein ACO3O0_10600 [Bacteroidia bacterium]